MASPVESARRAALQYEQARLHYLNWRAGERIYYWYPKGVEKEEAWVDFPADVDRPHKLEMLRAIDLVYAHLADEWKDKDGLPSAADFHAALDWKKLRELRDQEALLYSQRVQKLSELLSELREPTFATAFEALPPYRQLELLPTLVAGMAELDMGRVFLERAVETGGLLDPDIVAALPGKLGIDTGTVDAPTIALTPVGLKGASAAFGSLKPVDLVKHTCTLYTLFTAQVVPVVLYALRETGDTAAMAKVADGALDGVLPSGAATGDPPTRYQKAKAFFIKHKENRYAKVASHVPGTVLHVIDVYDAFVSLQKLAAAPTIDVQAVVDAGNVVGKLAVVSTQVTLQIAGDNATRAMLRCAAGAGVFMLAIDGIATVKGISDAGDLKDRSVQAGHAVKFAGAVVTTGGMVYGTLFLGGAALGPAGVAAVGFGIGLMLVGDALITFTVDPPLEQYAQACWFSETPTSSTDRNAVHFDFLESGTSGPDVAKPKLSVQARRLRTLLNPLGFKVVQGTQTTLSYERSPMSGRPLAPGTLIDLTFPEFTSAPPDLTAADATKLFEEGTVSVGRFDSRLDGKWVWLRTLTPPIPPLAGRLFGPNSPEALPKTLDEFEQL